jgi:hypothetical protein
MTVYTGNESEGTEKSIRTDAQETATSPAAAATTTNLSEKKRPASSKPKKMTDAKREKLQEKLKKLKSSWPMGQIRKYTDEELEACVAAFENKKKPLKYVTSDEDMASDSGCMSRSEERLDDYELSCDLSEIRAERRRKEKEDEGTATETAALPPIGRGQRRCRRGI